MKKTFYIQLVNDNIIRDVIEYEKEGYQKVELEVPLPIGINGGWWKYENGNLVECEELKPQTETGQRIEQLEQAILELSMLMAGVE